MFDKKKLNEEEQKKLDKLLLEKRLENFELYKKYIEPVYSKFFEQIKQLCIFFTVLNGTTLITAISVQNKILLTTTMFASLNFIWLFVYLIIIFYQNRYILVINNIDSDKNYINLAHSKIKFIANLTYLLIFVESFYFVGVIYCLGQYYQSQ